MKHLFHPIMGDSKYGDLHQNRALTTHTECSRLMLHAYQLSFVHPKTQQAITIFAPLDEQWQQLCQHFNWPIQHILSGALNG